MRHSACDVRKNNCPSETAMVADRRVEPRILPSFPARRFSDLKSAVAELPLFDVTIGELNAK